MTFAEFIRFVLWEVDNAPEVNKHWRPQFDICAPCYVHYDYYCYYETLHQDAKFIMSKIAAGSNVTFPLSEIGGSARGSDKYLKLFDNIPTSNIRRIVNMYRNDYRVLGYQIPDKIQRRLSE